MKTVLAFAALGLAALGLATPGFAEGLNVQYVRYTCDRDVQIPATFVTGEQESVLVMHIEGEQILLYEEVAASGAKYSWPSGGASYVLWSKGAEATIFWREDGVETQILACTTLE